MRNSALGYLRLSSVGIYIKRKIPRYLRKKVFTTQVFTFGGIYLFTNRVITHFGSNFLKIS